MEDVVEFLEDTHTYLVNGVIVPSVTQILHKIMPDKYKGIDSKILAKKAQYGTKGHGVIEFIGKNELSSEEALEYIGNLYCDKEINQDLSISLREYVRLANNNNLEVIANEKIINYKEVYAGTLDMIARVNGEKSLIDIKFTSELDKEYLSWQLGMYKLACNEEFDNYYCFWLPKGKIGKLEPIEIKTEEEIKEKLKELLNDISRNDE